MKVNYQVKLRDQSGSLVAIFDDWKTLNFNHESNAVGTCAFSINGLDSKVSLFETDGFLEVWRQCKDADLDWYIEWEGLVRTDQLIYDSDGEATYTVFCSKYLSLLSRRFILYQAGTSYTLKSGAGETVIKDFVSENCTSIATVENSRLSNGSVENLSIEVDSGRGESWAGERSYKNLLVVVREIALATGLAFDIVGDDAPDFTFEVYQTQRGTNRTNYGISRVTGLNSYGNVPVIFSLAFGNMGSPSLTNSRSGEINTVAVLGQGEGTDREYAVRKNADSISASPLNIIESIRNASNQTSTESLNAAGDSILEEKQPQELFDFEALQLSNMLYGKHYTWGDYITAEFGGTSFNKLISYVSVSISKGRIEKINIKFGDI